EATLRRDDPSDGPRASELFGQAIELLPRRYEAYFGRARCTERGGDASLADLEAAAARGAPTATVHLARAVVLRDLDREKEADAEEAAARATPSGDVRSKFFESQIAIQLGDREKARPLLDVVIKDAPRGSAERYLARRSRAAMRERVLDFGGALEDLL